MKVNLIGITKRAKEKLKRYGADDWEIIQEADAVGFSCEKGPWLLLRKDSIGLNGLRWVKMNNDSNFQIVRSE